MRWALCAALLAACGGRVATTGDESLAAPARAVAIPDEAIVTCDSGRVEAGLRCVDTSWALCEMGDAPSLGCNPFLACTNGRWRVAPPDPSYTCHSEPEPAEPTWRCEDRDPRCPPRRPLAGRSCGSVFLYCLYRDDEVGMNCEDGRWRPDCPYCSE
jgi:hypothetical protein